MSLHQEEKQIKGSSDPQGHLWGPDISVILVFKVYFIIGVYVCAHARVRVTYMARK